VGNGRATMHFRCSGALVCVVGNQGSRYRLSAWSATKARYTSGRPTLVRGSMERLERLERWVARGFLQRYCCTTAVLGRGKGVVGRRLKGAWVSAWSGDGDDDKV
jgi:hypothetical protein